jgi:hypothetical protein
VGVPVVDGGAPGDPVVPDAAGEVAGDVSAGEILPIDGEIEAFTGYGDAGGIPVEIGGRIQYRIGMIGRERIGSRQFEIGRLSVGKI